MDSQANFVSRIGQMFWEFLGYVTSTVQRYLTAAPPDTGNDDTNISPEARVCEEKNSDKEEEDNYLREETKRESKCWSHVDTADERVVNLMRHEIFLSNQMESMSEQCMSVYVTSTEKEQVNQHPEKAVLEEADDAQDKGDITQDIIKLGVEVEDTYIFTNEQENKNQDDKTTEDESHKSVDQRTEKKIELVEETDVRLPGDKYPFGEEDESKCEIKKERKNARKYEDLIQSNEVSIFRGHTEEHDVTEKVIGDSVVKEVVMTREDMMRDSNGKTEPVAGETPFEEDKVLLSDIIDTREIEPGETADGVEAGGAGQGSYEENERSTEETMVIESITKTSMGVLERGSKGEEMRGEWQEVQKSQRLETKKKSYKKDLAGADERDIRYLYELGREDRLGEEDGEECARIQPVQKEKMDNRKKAEKEEKSYEEKQEAKIQGEFGSGMYGGFETAIKKVDVSMENKESDKVRQEEEKREAEQNEKAEMGVQERLQVMEIEIKYETIEAGEGQDESRKTQMAGQDEVQRETQRNEKSKDEEILPESVLTLNMGQYERTEQQVEEEGDVNKLREELDEEDKSKGSMTEDRDESVVIEESGEDGERERCLFEIEEEENVYERMRDTEILHEERRREESKINEEVAASGVDVGESVEANKKVAEENKEISGTEWEDDINHEGEEYKESEREEISSKEEPAGVEVSIEEGELDKVQEEEEDRGAELNEKIEIEVQEREKESVEEEGDVDKLRDELDEEDKSQGSVTEDRDESDVIEEGGEDEERKRCLFESEKEENNVYEGMRDTEILHEERRREESKINEEVAASGVDVGESVEANKKVAAENKEISGTGWRDDINYEGEVNEENEKEREERSPKEKPTGVEVSMEDGELDKVQEEEEDRGAELNEKIEIEVQEREKESVEEEGDVDKLRDELDEEDKSQGSVTEDRDESDVIEEGGEDEERKRCLFESEKEESIIYEGMSDKEILHEEGWRERSKINEKVAATGVDIGESVETNKKVTEENKEISGTGWRDDINYEGEVNEENGKEREERSSEEKSAKAKVSMEDGESAKVREKKENRGTEQNEMVEMELQERLSIMEPEKKRETIMAGEEEMRKTQMAGQDEVQREEETAEVEENETQKNEKSNDEVTLPEGVFILNMGQFETEKERVEEEGDVDKLRDELDEEDHNQGLVTEDRDESDVIEEGGEDEERKRCLFESEKEENNVYEGMRDTEILHEERRREESKTNEEVAASGVDVGESVEANKKVAEENKEISGTEWEDDINYEGEEYKEREREEISSKEKPAGVEVSMEEGELDKVQEEEEDRGAELNEKIEIEVQEREKESVEEEGDVDKLRDELDEEDKSQGSVTEDRDESDVIEEGGEDGERKRCLFESEKEESIIYEGMSDKEILHEEGWRERSRINEKVAATGVDIGESVETNKKVTEENKEISGTEWRDDINHEGEVNEENEKEREERSSEEKSAKAKVSMEDGESAKVREKKENRGTEKNEMVEMELQERLSIMEPEKKRETIMAGEEEMRKTQMAGQDEVQREEETAEVEENETQKNEKSNDEVTLTEGVFILNVGQFETEKERVEEEGDVDKLRDELDEEDHNQGLVTEDRDESDVIEEGGEDGERERCLLEIEKEENNVYEGMRDTEILHEERRREESKINEEVAASGVDVGESVEANKEAAEENKEISGTEWEDDIKHEGEEYKEREREERSPKEEPTGVEVSMEDGELDKVQEEEENRGAELNEKIEIKMQEREEERVKEEGDVDKLRDELDEENKSQGSVTEDRDESDVIEQSGEDGERERCLFESEKEEIIIYEGMRDIEVLHEEGWREKSMINEEVAATGVDVGDSVETNKKVTEENKDISGTEWEDDINHEGEEYREREERSSKEEPAGAEISMKDEKSDQVREEKENRGAEMNEVVEVEVQEKLLLMEPEIKDETIMAGEGEEEMRKTQVAGQDKFQREEQSAEVEKNATQRYEKSNDEVTLPEGVFTLDMRQFAREKERVEEEGDVDKLRDELDEEDKNQGYLSDDRDESDVIVEGVEDGERERCLFEIEKEENNASAGMRDTEILHEERWREESKINEEVAASWVDVGESVVVEEGDVDKLRDELDEENKNQGSVTEDRDESGVIKASREDGERERCLFELGKEEKNDSEGMRDTEILHEERWREESKIIEEVAVSWIDVGESETCEVNVQNLREGKNLEISVTELRDDRKHRENVYELKEHEIFDISTEVQPYENINIFHEALDMSKENETKSDLQQTVEPQINEDNIFGRNSHIIDLLKVAEEQETKKEERDNECPEKQSTILIVGETKDEGHVSDENVDIKTMEEGDGMDFNVAPATKSELIEGFSANIVTEGITLRDGWAIEKTEETINNDRSESGDTPYAVDRGAIRGAESGRDINESTMSTTEGQRPKIQLKIEKGVKLEEDEIFTKAKDIQSQFSDAKLHKTSEHRKLLAESTGQSRTIIVNEETDGNEGRKHITKDGVGKKRIRKRTHENEEEEFNLQLDSPSLDFTAQKSRIALKNRHIRAPKDPRILLQIPSLSPTSAPPTLDEEAATKPAGIKVGGVEMMRFKLPGIGAGFPVLKKTERRVEERGEEGTGQMTIKAPTPNLGPEDREPAGTKKWAAGSVGVKLPGFGPGMPALRKTDKGVKLIEKTTDDATVSPGKCDTSSGGGAERNGEESKEKGIKSVGPSTIKLPSFGAGFPMLRKTERGSKMRGEEGKTSEAERNETENNQPEKPGSDSSMLVSELKKKFMKTERK